ncbi:MAG: hypothetical protein PVF58_14360 [Candidatus Methanofastidiosia archaeon]|jgi:hypothetical protein
MGKHNHIVIGSGGPFHETMKLLYAMANLRYQKGSWPGQELIKTEFETCKGKVDVINLRNGIVWEIETNYEEDNDKQKHLDDINVSRVMVKDAQETEKLKELKKLIDEIYSEIVKEVSNTTP